MVFTYGSVVPFESMVNTVGGASGSLPGLGEFILKKPKKKERFYNKSGSGAFYVLV